MLPSRSVQKEEERAVEPPSPARHAKKERGVASKEGGLMGVGERASEGAWSLAKDLFASKGSCLDHHHPPVCACPTSTERGKNEPERWQETPEERLKENW